MRYNIQMKMADLLENAQAAAALDCFLPGLRPMAEANPQACGLSVEQLARYSRIPQAAEALPALDAALQALNTPENAISPREAEEIARFQALDAADQARAPKPQTHTQNAIYPGRPWLDTKGERIQAHGGAVIYEDGVYYWYGENKEHGYLIPPVLDDPDAPLYPTKRVDRPHLLRCPATGKYVCWIKLSGPEAAFTIWQADRLLGPYTMVEALYRPGDHKAGDFDLVADAETGRGYLYFDADHNALLCMELTPDYLHADREVARSYPDLHPPFTREGPALFAQGGKKYLLTSGMTGYVPNRSDSAACASWDGVFTSLGDPHIDDASCASFNSQISKVFRIEGTDTFVAMADRWLPGTPVNARLADVFTRVVASAYEPDKYQATETERREMYAANRLETANTSIADYVWLPVTIENGKPCIRWLDAWTPDSL